MYEMHNTCRFFSLLRPSGACLQHICECSWSYKIYLVLLGVSVFPNLWKRPLFSPNRPSWERLVYYITHEHTHWGFHRGNFNHILNMNTRLLLPSDCRSLIMCWQQKHSWMECVYPHTALRIPSCKCLLFLFLPCFPLINSISYKYNWDRIKSSW